ncbi:transposase [Streptomyces sp. NPDC090301]|uniref:transposase n=1 Tax=Streptomyces sp. NPDC090301 TaxID=3154975 RepID=UPI0034349275
MAGVITVSDPSWIAPFTGLSPRAFGKLVTVLRREGADVVRKGRPWGLPLEDRALLVAAYWRTNLTMRQLAPLFGSRSQRRTESSITSGRGLRSSPASGPPTTRSSSTPTPAWSSWSAGRSPGTATTARHGKNQGAKAAVGRTLTIADSGYPGTGLVIPHRRGRGQSELPDWKEQHNKSHKQVRARVEHVFARMKTWKILRDCRLEGDGVHHAMLGIARMHNLALAG